VSLEQIAQLTVAGIINGSFYALVGAAFGLILGVTGRFHYAFALVFTLAAYVTSVLEAPAGLPTPLAVIGGLFAAAVLGVALPVFEACSQAKTMVCVRAGALWGVVGYGREN
jgi:branched-subunit amino acid ABC-type transport system permease component